MPKFFHFLLSLRKGVRLTSWSGKEFYALSQSAIDAEVEAFIGQHAHRRDEQGKRLVVKNGSLPEREILTGAGATPIKQGRVRDNTLDLEQRVVLHAPCTPRLNDDE